MCAWRGFIPSSPFQFDGLLWILARVCSKIARCTGGNLLKLLKAPRRSRLCGLALYATAVFYAPNASADQVSWQGGTGDWLNAGNWIDINNGLNQVPTSIDDVYIQNGGAAQLSSGNGGASTLTLGSDLGQSGTLLLSSGATLSVANDEYVGTSGNGTVNQSGGIHTIGTGTADTKGLFIGFNSGSAGAYILGGTGSLNVVGVEYIGYLGSGSFIQTGGTHNFGSRQIGSYMSIGEVGAGTYSLGNGTASSSAVLNVFGSENIGNGGSGNFIQTGGTNNLGSAAGGFGLLNIGASGVGTYSLGNGTASCSAVLNLWGEEQVGAGGSGTFIQTGGTHNIGMGGLEFQSNLYIGVSGIAGTYVLGNGTLDSSAVLNVSGGEGIGNGGPGIFMQTGGTHNLGSETDEASIYLGVGAGGTYSLGNGTASSTAVLNVFGDEELGWGSNPGTGNFIQTGGTHNLGSATSESLINIGMGKAGTYSLGNGTNSSSAVLNVFGQEDIGGAGPGNLIQTGGTNNLGPATVSLLDVGFGPSTGTYSLGSGTIVSSAILNVFGKEDIGDGGTGIFIQTGGTHNLGSATLSSQMIIGDRKSGTYSLGNGTSDSGAVLNVWGVEYVGYRKPGTFVQTGGTHTLHGTLELAANSGSTGNYSLQGGTLLAGTVQVNANSTINYNGGIFKADSLTLSGGEVLLGSGHNRAVEVGIVSVSSGGIIDLNDNGMIVDYPDGGPSPIDSIRSLIQTNSITSSAASGATELIYGEASDMGITSFFGQSVDSSAVVVGLSYGGDANMDGIVDIRDLRLLAESWHNGDTGYGADFNHDGRVDVADLFILSQNWQQGAALLESQLTSLELPNINASVPEPSSFVWLCGLTALFQIRRQRRSHR